MRLYADSPRRGNALNFTRFFHLLTLQKVSGVSNPLRSEQSELYLLESDTDPENALWRYSGATEVGNSILVAGADGVALDG